MAQTFQITCVNKSDRPNPHERITHFGGTAAGGKRWKLTQASVITGVENGMWKFFVSVDGKSVRVIVSTSQHGEKYLKTENDSEQPNNLLSLPECP